MTVPTYEIINIEFINYTFHLLGVCKCVCICLEVSEPYKAIALITGYDRNKLRNIE